jgi:hypothetical protein
VSAKANLAFMQYKLSKLEKGGDNTKAKQTALSLF